MAGRAGNPYAAPKVSVSDAAPRLGIGTRAARALAFVGNAFLLLLPLFFLFSNRRLDTGFFFMAGYYGVVAAPHPHAHAFHEPCLLSARDNGDQLHLDRCAQV